MTWSALAALGVFGALLILLRHVNYGVGLDDDAGPYIAAARNLVAGNGFLLWHGGPYQGAVPLFPLLLAAAGFVGLDVIAAAGYVNAAAFGLTVVAVAAWVKRHARSPWLAVWAGSACALSPALAFRAAFAAPEVAFVLLVVVSLSRLDRFFDTGKTLVLLLAAAAAAAACLTHYLGVTVIGAGMLVLLLHDAAVKRTRNRDAAIWLAVSLGPAGVWVMRNLLVTGTPFGPVAAAPFSGLISLHRATGELVSWLLGHSGLDLLNGAVRSAAGIDLTGAAAPAAIAVQAAILAAAALGAGALARRRPGFARRHRTVLTIALVFAAAYLLAGVVLPVRYLLPLFPPLLVVSALVLGEASKQAGRVGRVVASVMWLWLALPAVATYGDVRRWIDDGPGIGYASKRWIESDVIRYLNANPLAGAAVWSTAPLALYFHTDHRLVVAMDSSLGELTERLGSRSPAAPTYLVWFDDSSRRGRDYGAGDVAALPGAEPVADLEDGVIFRIVAAADVIVRSTFDIYLFEDALVYFKEPCTPADTQADFFLHVVPVDAADLSAAARARGSFFNSLDFALAERGGILDGRCLAVVPLDYEIAQLHTGQFRPGLRPFWEVHTTARQHLLLPLRRVYRAVLEGVYGAPAASADFDVYLTESGLTYVREQCSAQDTAAPFFLHVVPVDAADLSAAARARGSFFNSLDFALAERGGSVDGRCLAVVPLDYEIAHLHTGQFWPGRRPFWEEKIARVPE